MKMSEKSMKSRRGATFIEYALLAGLVAIVVAVAAMMFGKEIKGLFSDTGNQVKSVSSGVQKANLSADTSGGGEKDPKPNPGTPTE